MYDTKDPGMKVTVEQLKKIEEYLKEHFGCFKLFAIDNAGHGSFIEFAESPMEKTAINALIDSDGYEESEGDGSDDEDNEGDEWKKKKGGKEPPDKQTN